MQSQCTCPQQIRSLNDLCLSCQNEYAEIEMWRLIFEDAERAARYASLVSNVYTSGKEVN